MTGKANGQLASMTLRRASPCHNRRSTQHAPVAVLALMLLLLLAVAGSYSSCDCFVHALQINTPVQHRSFPKCIPRTMLRSSFDVQTSPQVGTSQIRPAFTVNNNKQRERRTSLSPLFNSRSKDDADDNDTNIDTAKSTTRAIPTPYIAPWIRAILVFGVGYGLGNASAPGWQRHARVSSKIGVTRIALAILICRDVWRSTPKWVKPRVTKYARKMINMLLFWRSIGGGGIENENGVGVDGEDDVDDITDLSNFSTKIQGVIDVAKNKLDSEDNNDPRNKEARDDFNVQASFLAFLQLLWQVKSRRASSRDQIYRSSGTTVPDEMLEGMDDMFELADLAYDEHKDGDIKRVLKGMGYNLIKHDTTAVPGYLGHYIAINSDPLSGEKTAVIGVKGTSNFEDFLTDMCASAVEYNLTNPFYEGGSNALRCHEGVFISSQRLVEELLPVVKNLLIPSGYKITIVGHSLGAGCATLLAILLRSSIPSLQDNNDQLKVWAFASPPVLDLSSAVGCSQFVTTVVNNCDVVPRANISPLAITVRLLRAVNERLKERNLSMSNFQSSLAFLNKIREGKDGEMLMNEDEIFSVLDEALERTDLQDPDHLYVPGKVVVMYDLWEKEQNRMQKQQQLDDETDFTDILKGWMQTLKTTNGHSSDVGLDDNIPTAEEAILCDGTCKALRFVELDGRLIDDHMAPQYRSSIANIMSSRIKSV